MAVMAVINFWDDRIDFKMIFLKILRLSDFRIFFGNLLEGKKEFLKNLVSL